MREMFAGPRAARLSFSLVIVLYFLTRIGNLFRDLVSEEVIYLMSGVNWITGRGYFYDWGVLNPHAYHFGHPPLTSILLALLSRIACDPVIGGRLLPFLVGLFACLVPLLISRSIVPSLLILMSPLMFGASGHMQTDPTCGLLGYSLVCLGMAGRDGEITRGNAWQIAGGIAILWLTKFETAAIASAMVATFIALYRTPQRGRILRGFILASVLGIGSCILVTWLLGRTDGLSVGQSAGEYFVTLNRMAFGTLEMHAHNSHQETVDRDALLSHAADFRTFQFLLICTLPALAIMTWRGLGSRNRPHLFLLAGGLLPFVVYLLVAWPGDFFPRYFVIAFPFLGALLGLTLCELPRNARVAVSAVVLLLGAATMLPQTLQMMLSPGSVTVFRGERGTRDAAVLVSSLVHPGELALGPDAMTYYAPHVRWMVDSTFAPYPGMEGTAMSMAPRLRAAVVRPSDWQSGIVGKVVATLLQRGAHVMRVGTYWVAIDNSEFAPPAPANPISP